MKILATALLLVFAAPALADEGKCPRMNKAMLDEITANRGGKVKIVFFSSRCAECKDQLTVKASGPTILIGAFDERERLEEVVKSLDVKTECYTDDGVTEALGVTTLPMTLDYGVKTAGE